MGIHYQRSKKDGVTNPAKRCTGQRQAGGAKNMQGGLKRHARGRKKKDKELKKTGRKEAEKAGRQER
jgi:hypothetical protein